jgi:hypothetical protein
MVACTLAFDLDWENTLDFIPRTTMYRPILWPRSLSYWGVDFDEQDSVAFLTAEAHDLLTFGSVYLQYVGDDTGICVHPC